MKRLNVIIAIIFIILGICILVGIIYKDILPKTTTRSLSKIEMSIKEGTLTANSATLVIKDKNFPPGVYGESYSIKQKVDGKWQSPPVLEPAIFPAIATMVDEKTGTIEWNLNWTRRYGKLSPGTYRIVKPLEFKKDIWVEFVIK